MSSTIAVKKICQYCSKTFTAKTQFTKYCSLLCNNRDYKAIKREQKIKDSQLSPLSVPTIDEKHNTPIQPEQPKDYFLLNEAAVHMRISLRTLHRLIQVKKLKKKKINARTVISRIDIQDFFNNQ